MFPTGPALPTVRFSKTLEATWTLMTSTRVIFEALLSVGEPIRCEIGVQNCSTGFSPVQVGQLQVSQVLSSLELAECEEVTIHSG